jgi:cellulose biosynthesis protein BcsQ
MKEPKFVAFSTQKGGAGKTTLTVTMASYLYYCMGLKIIVVDCDYPQYSINDMREREKMLLELSPSFKKTFSDTLLRTKLKPFPVLVCPPEEAMKKVRDLIEEGEDVDIVFFDLPGTVNNRGVVNVVNCMDMVVVPSPPTMLSLKARSPSLSNYRNGSRQAALRLKGFICSGI